MHAKQPFLYYENGYRNVFTRNISYHKLFEKPLQRKQLITGTKLFQWYRMLLSTFMRSLSKFGKLIHERKTKIGNEILAVDL